ncbi:MAG: sodium:proton antiporter [Chlorobi bacterium]|nr:sodium:proton antiporter [Chlorobiota bacterium]MCI0714704.1 sodium:proton antiporter [Chlorobiota bacterium]
MEPSLLSVLPFIFLLLSIAVLPFILPKFWHDNYHWVSLGLGFMTTIYYIFITKGWDILHSIEEYTMFISLLTALYIVSGGILIEIKGLATPFRNVVLLALGGLIANFIGTTGASMLLIRPYIKTNKLRITSFHIVFFIFIVSNVGGALTPIGDPPLFLGFLKGIPFFWVIDKVFWKWLTALLALLIVFYIFDYINFKRQPEKLEEREIKAKEKIELKGWYNFLLLAVVIASVFITEPLFLREAIMLSTAFISYKLTNNEIHKRNHFDFHPIKEVAWLFIGIFITMTPALELLRLHSSELGITSPSQYFWFTGFLSGFLDNAPTYLTFLTAAMGVYGLNINDLSDVLFFIAQHERHVVAISISAVFFGAMTYIGNGPNFMVKSIAAHQKVDTPSFFGYMLKYSIPILIPLFILEWLLFIA